ncbi:MAG: GNAT family N-acetyltransferase [Candidatus Bathyarchaeota archaeon]|nr:GNAT family N-acetyltransferase [Candidatus Bathyarchaeota archaeon]
MQIRQMREDDITPCANLATSLPLGKTYGFKTEEWIQKLQRACTEKGNLLFVAEEEGRLAGFVWVHTHGAFLAAPYLRFIAVDPEYQGRGVGTLLLKEFEELTRYLKKDWFLLVSDFNTGAQRFYERHGYQRVGELPGFAKEGVAEVIMVKKHEDRD